MLTVGEFLWIRMAKRQDHGEHYKDSGRNVRGREHGRLPAVNVGPVAFGSIGVPDLRYCRISGAESITERAGFSGPAEKWSDQPRRACGRPRTQLPRSPDPTQMGISGFAFKGRAPIATEQHSHDHVNGEERQYDGREDCRIRASATGAPS
jgi:hypothetical protein